MFWTIAGVISAVWAVTTLVGMFTGPVVNEEVHQQRLQAAYEALLEEKRAQGNG